MVPAIAPTEHHSVYIHIPFCQVRCSYCDFNTYAGLNDLIPAYTQALRCEIERVAESLEGRLPVHTVYFGGGTPSLVPPDHLAPVFDALRSGFQILPEAEITLEANPGTLSLDGLRGLRALGVNRLSLGVQSVHSRELRLFDRLHTFDEAVAAVELARRAGFDNLNLDLIFGIPDQTLPMWRESLARTLALGPEHLSLYALSLEHGTPLRSWVQRGLIAAPNPDLAAQMYEWACDHLEAREYGQYEISNWATGTEDRGPGTEDRRTTKDRRPGTEDRRTTKDRRPGTEDRRTIKDERRMTNDQEPATRGQQPATSRQRPTTSDQQPATDYQSRHNLQYWRNLPYLGLGAGAHGCAPGWRYSTVLGPRQYVERMQPGRATAFPFTPALAERHRVSPAEAMDETMMLGMRLVEEGVSPGAFLRRHGVRLEARYADALDSLRRRGLIEVTPERVRLTARGRLLGNRVFSAFLLGDGG